MIANEMPEFYRQYWDEIRNIFIGLSVAIVASNLIAAGAMVWAALKLTRGSNE